MTRWDDIPNPPMTWNDVLSLGDAVDPAALRSAEDSVDPYSTVNIQFTSGTTGSPKAAMLSHQYGTSLRFDTAQHKPIVLTGVQQHYQ